MKINNIFLILVNFCVLIIDVAEFKPVPDLEADPEGCVHSEHKLRARRSLPDSGVSDVDVGLPPDIQVGRDDPQVGSPPRQGSMASGGAPSDPANPSNLEAPTPLEGPPDPSNENEVSAFALGDQSRNDKDSQPLPQVNPGSADAPARLATENERLQGEWLPSDEQADCYRQQNIEPPNDSPREPFDRPRPILRLKDQRPFADVFPNSNSPRMMSRPAIYKEKGSRRWKGDDNVITSLYSDSEIRPKSRNQKAMFKSPKESREPALVAGDTHQPSVYKPVGVRPEFPVYDEDIDFHPDPLQGILEDKYWLDPQEQEAVIRKYIDLANNNMQPARHDFEKRELSGEHVPKSVDSKEAFKEAEAAEGECPCREMSACKDCKKGKWGGSKNFSEDGLLNDKYESRKLLSVDNDDYEEGTDADESEFHKADNHAKIARGISDDSKTESGILGDGVLDSGELEMSNEEEVPSFTSNYFGRKLLSIEHNSDEDYAVDEDSEETDYVTTEGMKELSQSENNVLHHESESFNKDENVALKTYDRRSVSSEENDGNSDENAMHEKRYNGPVIVRPSNSGVFEYKFETEKLGAEAHEKLNPAEEFMAFQKPFLENRQMAKYYVPDKLGNFLQRVIHLKQTPKEKSTTIDPDVEFALEQNQTYVNVSWAMSDSKRTSTMSPVKHHKRRVKSISSGGKGRRSYQLPLLKHPNVKKLQADDMGSVNVPGENTTLNESSSVDASSTTNTPLTSDTVSNNTAENATDLNLNATGSSLNGTANTLTTANATTNATTVSSWSTAKTTKKKEDYDEDSFDAEIANDIVESVFAESQSGSVVGHNLGLCRRNDSVSKYARVSPESEQLLKKVTECILDRIRDRLEGQSCTLLDNELLQFLKWMVLGGESYREYLARVRPELRQFKSEVHDEGVGPPPGAHGYGASTAHHASAGSTPVTPAASATPKHA